MLGVTLDFVRRKVAGRGGRSVNAALNLTSYIDFLLVTVIFLLMSFSASGAPAGADIALPSAENGEDMVEAPMIAVNGQTVMVDGAPAGDVRAVRDAGRLGRIDALFELLRKKQELWSVLHPDRAFPGVALLQIDGDVETLVVKSVFQTAAVAGYPNLSFMVRHRTHARGAD
ncbi:MAG: biopolymer transporter ExbD [Polyangiaceae bacterium]|nr:biopolymer transporter ExbD [Polyangiaceae bacterium]